MEWSDVAFGNGASRLGKVQPRCYFDDVFERPWLPRVFSEGELWVSHPQTLESLDPAEVRALTIPWLADHTVDRLLEFSRLESLDLSRAPISSGGLARLGALKLKRLKLENCQHLGPGALEALSRHEPLQVLDLESTFLKDGVLQDCAWLRAFPELHTLSLAQQPSLTNLQGIERCTELRSLTLRTTRISSLTPLLSLSELSSLDLSMCRSLSASSVQALSDIPSLRSLNLRELLAQGTLPTDWIAKLSLHRLGLEQIQLASFAPLAQMNLRALALKGTGMRANDIQHILGQHDLEALDLAWNDIPMHALAPLTALKKLRWLGLSHKPPTRKLLRELAKLPNLTTLEFSGPSKDPKLCKELAKLSNLRHLNLANATVDSANLSALAKLQKLETLDMAWCVYVPPGSYSFLAELPALRWLELRTVSQPDIDVLQAHSRLQQLKLGDGNKLSAEELILFANIPSLSALEISGCEADDRLLDALTEKGLRKLHLHGSSKLSTAAVKRFIARNPGCHTVDMSSGASDRALLEPTKRIQEFREPFVRAADAHAWISANGRSARALNQSGEEKTLPHRGGTRLRTVCLSNTGDLLASISGAGPNQQEIRVFDLSAKAQKPRPTVQIQTDSNLYAIAFSHDSQHLLTTGSGAIQIFETSSGRETGSIQAAQGVHRLSASPSSSLVAVMHYSDGSQLFDWSARAPLWSSPDAQTCTFSHTSFWFAKGSKIFELDLESFKETLRLDLRELNNQPIPILDCHKGAKNLSFGGRLRCEQIEIKWIALDKQGKLRALIGHGHRWLYFAWTPHGHCWLRGGLVPNYIDEKYVCLHDNHLGELQLFDLDRLECFIQQAGKAHCAQLATQNLTQPIDQLDVLWNHQEGDEVHFIAKITDGNYCVRTKAQGLWLWETGDLKSMLACLPEAFMREAYKALSQERTDFQQ